MNQQAVGNYEAVPSCVERAGNGCGPIRLVISGRQVISRQGLRALLMSISGFEVVNEASDGATGLELALHDGADVLVHDLTVPDDSELDFLRRINSEALPVRVLLLAVSLERPNVLNALQQGAHGIVPKDSATFRALTEALKVIAAGCYWVGAQHASTIVEALQALESGEDDHHRFGLTARELEIIPLMVQGCSNREIARELAISIQTVKHHCSHIYDKLGASNRLELALFAIHHRLTDESHALPLKKVPQPSAAACPVARPSTHIPSPF